METKIQLQGHNVKEYDLSCDDVYPYTIASAVFMDSTHSQTLDEWAQTVSETSELPIVKQEVASLTISVNKLQVSTESIKDLADSTSSLLKDFLFEKWNKFLQMCIEHDTIPGEDIEQLKYE